MICFLIFQAFFYQSKDWNYGFEEKLNLDYKFCEILLTLLFFDEQSFEIVLDKHLQ